MRLYTKIFAHPMTIFVTILMTTILFLSGCNNKNNPVGPPQGEIETGDFNEILNGNISQNGGTLSYTKVGDSLFGFLIGVPKGSYSSNRIFKIEIAPIKNHNFGAQFVPLTPMIRISNGGGYSDSIMTLEIPIKLPAGYFPMAFYYDNETGELEGIPTGAITDDRIYIGTRHFDGKSLSDGKSPTIQATQTYADLIVAAVKLGDLNKSFTTGFLPGIDDWEFTNHGSYIAPGGHCAGQTLTSMWYYSVKKLKEKKHSLYGYYDEIGYGVPDTMWKDNPMGYRFASVVQRQYQINDINSIVDNWFTKFNDIGKRRFTKDSLHYLSLLYAFNTIKKPQLIVIFSSQGGGHALVAYKGGNGIINIADPNYPGITTREIEFVNGNFKPYMSGDNADNLGKPFENINYTAKSALIDFEQIESAWQDFEQHKSGDGYFPDVQLEYKNENGEFVPAPDPLVFLSDSVILRCVCQTCAITFTNKTIQLELINEKGKVLAYSDADGLLKVIANNLTPRYGLTIFGYPQNNQNREYIDFKWLTLINPKFEIESADKDGVPIKKAGEINKQYNFKINGYGNFPPSPKFVWDFGDNSSQVTKYGKDTTANHTYTKEGSYNIKVKIYNNDNSALISEITAKAKIGNNPIITSITPTKGPDGQVVIINGSSFGDHQRDGDRVCLFLEGDSYRAIYSTEWSDTQIKTIINTATDKKGTMQLKVRLYDSDKMSYRWSEPVPFEVIKCEFTSIEPTILITDSIATLTGTGFGTYSEEDGIFLYDKKVKEIISWTDNKITFKVPKILLNGGFDIYLTKGMTDQNDKHSGHIYRYEPDYIYWQPTPSFILEYLPISVKNFNSYFSYDVDVTTTYYDASGKPYKTSDNSLGAQVSFYENNNANISVNGRTFRLWGNYSGTNGSFECTGTISSDGKTIEQATIIRKDDSDRLIFRCSIENLPLYLHEETLLPMILDEPSYYQWIYSAKSNSFSLIKDFYYAVYTSEGKLHNDSKIKGSRKILLLLRAGKKQ